jgi:putative transposase/transposase-like zinc-binding protein
MTTATTTRPAVEVAEVIRQHGEAFLSRHGGYLTAVQKKALRDLARCRTAALGGHVEHCLDCGHERPAYNSCRNRHCPKCQAGTRARWLEREATFLLPVEYHHVVFTVPAELSALARANPTVLYETLFQAASATLREVAANPKRLGAQIGVLMALHTWGQNLRHHPHLHCVCTGGGLSCDKQARVAAVPHWRSCRPGFFLPVRVLSRLFRGKFLDRLRTAFDQGRLIFPGELLRLQQADAFARWLTPLYAQDWVVYAKRPFGGPEQVLKYLARYTHRVAISNSRLLKLADGQVTFRYKDYADAHRHKTMTLSADEFLRRFVQHVLPKGFVKIRHYGLLANRPREERLALCRRLLFVKLAGEPGASATGVCHTALGVEPVCERRCPHCSSQRLVYRELPPQRQARTPQRSQVGATRDTS